MLNSSPEAERELILTVLKAAATVERRLDRALSGTKGISFSEYQILEAIERDRGATRVDLADRVGLTPSGVTRALKPLEKLGFVETVRDHRDARRSMACLTAEGTELVSDAAGVVDDVVTALPMVGLLKASDRPRILGFLQALAHG